MKHLVTALVQLIAVILGLNKIPNAQTSFTFSFQSPGYFIIRMVHLPALTHQHSFFKPQLRCILKDVMFIFKAVDSNLFFISPVITCTIVHICHAAGQVLDNEDPREETQVTEIILYWSQINMDFVSTLKERQ